VINSFRKRNDSIFLFFIFCRNEKKIYWISFSERIWIFVRIIPWVESVIVITNYFMSIGFWCYIAIVFNCYNSVNFINKCLISPIVGLVWSVDYQLLNIPTWSPWSWAWIIMIFLFLGTFKKLSYQSGLGFGSNDFCLVFASAHTTQIGNTKRAIQVS
jgi:hypothetical protein